MSAVPAHAPSSAPAVLLVDDRRENLLALEAVLAEALRNALKHSDPTRVVVRVRCRDGAFVLEVVNDGVATSQRRTGMGMGLRLAAFEALQQGGVIEFGQRADDAWRVRLLVPVEDAR